MKLIEKKAVRGLEGNKMCEEDEKINWRIIPFSFQGCMQRLDYHVLVPYLQPKLEYVISINMTDLQSRLYKFYLENYAKAGQVGLDGKLEGGKKGGLFYDVQNLSRIWNHPYILHLSKLRKMDKVIKNTTFQL